MAGVPGEGGVPATLLDRREDLEAATVPLQAMEEPRVVAVVKRLIIVQVCFSYHIPSILHPLVHKGCWSKCQSLRFIS